MADYTVYWLPANHAEQIHQARHLHVSPQLEREPKLSKPHV
jgi:hypothetical protein